MIRREQLDRLGALAKLILDLRLADVQAAGKARDQSLGHLRALAAAPAQDLDPVAAALTDLRYQQWADLRRGEINLTLARQTATWMEAQGRARHAFGQAEVLQKLQSARRG
jgi:hypothetical protein